MFTAKKFLHTINAIFCFEIELLLLLSRLCMDCYNAVMDPMVLHGAVQHLLLVCFKAEAAEEEERGDKTAGWDQHTCSDLAIDRERLSQDWR
jgi:hypothetical protein